MRSPRPLTLLCLCALLLIVPACENSPFITDAELADQQALVNAKQKELDQAKADLADAEKLVGDLTATLAEAKAGGANVEEVRAIQAELRAAQAEARTVQVEADAATREKDLEAQVLATKEQLQAKQREVAGRFFSFLPSPFDELALLGLSGATTWFGVRQRKNGIDLARSIATTARANGGSVDFNNLKSRSVLSAAMSAGAKRLVEASGAELPKPSPAG